MAMGEVYGEVVFLGKAKRSKVYGLQTLLNR